MFKELYKKCKSTEEKQKKVWESISNGFSWYETKCSPTSWNIFKYREGWYLHLRFVLLSVFFLFANSRIILRNFLFGVFTVAFLLDIIIANTANAFITKNPIDSLRSFLLTFYSFIHVILIYGIFYRFLEHEFTSKMCASQAIYFSVVTITTLGYGDFVPQKWGTITQMVIVCEVITGLFLIIGIFAKIINAKEKNISEKKSNK